MSEKRLIDIDEYIKWYNETYKNWQDDCTKNKERATLFYNLYTPHSTQKDNSEAVSDGSLS